MNELCAKNKKQGIEDWGYGKGYIYLAEDIGKMLNLLNELIDTGINVVLVAHAQTRKFELPDEMGAFDKWELKLHKKVASLIKEWADIVLFAKYKTHVINVDNQGALKGKNKAQGGSRVMMTTHNPCWDAKNRHGLAEELSFNYSEIAHCIPSGGKSYSAPTTPTPQETEQKIQPQEQQEKTKSGPGEVDKKEAITKPSDSDLSHLPKALADLMAVSNVAEWEIQKAVANRGYYPDDTPIKNYEQDFINGVLVGAWGKVYDMIEKKKKTDDWHPF
jgi:hypothetical protein